MPQARGECIVRGEEREHAVLDEAGLDIRREIVGQKRGQIALERRHLLDARAQGAERVGPIQHVGQGLRTARIEPPRRRP